LPDSGKLLHVCTFHMVSPESYGFADGIAHPKCAIYLHPDCDLHPRDTRTDSQVSNSPLGSISEVPSVGHTEIWSLSGLLPAPLDPPTASRFLRPESGSSTSSGTSLGTSSLWSRATGTDDSLTRYHASSGTSLGTSSRATSTDDSLTRHHGTQSAMFDVDTRASDSLLSTKDDVDAWKTSSVVSASGAPINTDMIRGKFPPAQKKRDRDTNGCNVQ
jgi:hypothetical protein